MRIAVIGASRGVGRAVVAAARRRGYDVTALARSGVPSHDEQGPTVHWIRGSATDPDALTRTVAGVDAVVVTLGAPARAHDHPRARGTRVVVDTLRAVGPRRILVNSSLGVGDSASLLNPLVRYVLVPLFMKRALDDHAEQEGIVRSSGLDWTILRPGGLTDAPASGAVAAGFTSAHGVAARISRADVAAYAVEHLQDASTFGRAIALGSLARDSGHP